MIKNINEANNYQELSKTLDKLNTNDMADEKITELSEILLKKYKSINSDIFPYIIEYYYSKSTLKEFKIAIYLLHKLYNRIEFVTDLENIILDEEKFLELVPILSDIVMDNFHGISDCMYLVLLNHDKYYEKIEDKYKGIIKNSLYKIGIMLDYLAETKTKPTNDMLKSLEIMVDVARMYNDSKILKYVERSLDIDDIEINLFSVCTLIYNNVQVPDAYINELAKENRTCKRFYKILRNMNRLYRFPEEYLTKEHLAMSDMVNWLMHPAELANVPDTIEFVKSFEMNDEEFFVFKFTSNIEKFKDKGQMIGISGGYKKNSEPTIDNSGYTFSDFDKFEEDKIMELSQKIIDKINKLSKKASKN